MAFSPFLEDILQVTGKGRNLRKREENDQKERKIRKILQNPEIQPKNPQNLLLKYNLR